MPGPPDTNPASGGGLDIDTIAAVATPAGRGGIGIVRLSGPDSESIVAMLTGNARLPARRPVLRDFLAADREPIDRGLVVWFPAPGSFTGESVVELHGHGGRVLMQLLLNRTIELGARAARPGEFSERAFGNGRLDLAQAEAVADLIDSGSEAAAKSAMRSLSGVLSRRVDDLAQRMVEVRVAVEAAIDFPDEDDQFLEEGRISERLAGVIEGLEGLLAQARQGQLLGEGANVVLTGAPNVGKSSLLNALAGESRAIVTDIPGTTRDVLAVDLIIDGLPVRLLDTAGLRAGSDAIEAEGVRRARAAADTAHLVIEVVDAREPIGERRADRTLVVANKSDLAAPLAPSAGLVVTSALTGAGLDALRSAIVAGVGYVGGEVSFVARARHVDALAAASGHLDQAVTELAGSRYELVAEALSLAHRSLGEIVGQVTADELLGRIFATFCIGK